MFPDGIVVCIYTLLHLLQKLNEKVGVVVDYESGRAIPNQQILSKMERVLGETAWYYNNSYSAV